MSKTPVSNAPASTSPASKSPSPQASPTSAPSLPTSVQATALRTVFALPKRLKRAIAGKPLRIDGLELALDAQLLLKLQRMSGQSQLSRSRVEVARTAMRESGRLVKNTPVNGVEMTPRRIPTPDTTLDARLYRPEELTEPGELLVFYHGGGFVLGGLDSHEDSCRFLAKNAGVRVLSVDYRLAPENPFPAAFDDAVAAYFHAVEHATELGTEPGSIAVGGDSAGGNLAAGVARHATRSDKASPVFQMLIYPAVDATARRHSREVFGNGLLLTDVDMDWFMDQYEPASEVRSDPRLSPLLADDLSGLPPAYVVTGGFDPLRDEGEAYARRLSEEGVPVIARRFPDLIHGFVNLRPVGGRFQEALCEIAGTLRAGLRLRA